VVTYYFICVGADFLSGYRKHFPVQDVVLALHPMSVVLLFLPIKSFGVRLSFDRRYLDSFR
jgi:hypothetical protein